MMSRMTDDARPLPDRLRLPHRHRLDPEDADYDLILRRHEEAMAAGRSHYVDPRSGALVFTAAALWERGYCCDSGCRHCPYLEGR